jgi:hypothetical protein
MERNERAQISKVEEEDLNAIRERRVREFRDFMKREPEELEPGKRYRNGKRRYYGDLVCTLLVDENEDGLEKFCEKIATEDYELLQNDIHCLHENLEKILEMVDSLPETGADLEKNVSDFVRGIRWKVHTIVRSVGQDVYTIMERSGHVGIPLGAFLGQNYRMNRKVQKEIDDIGKRMREEGALPLIAKRG